MKLAYPGKFNNSMSARDIHKKFVLHNREIHLNTINQDPQSLMEKFVPMFLNGLNNIQKNQNTAA